MEWIWGSSGSWGIDDNNGAIFSCGMRLGPICGDISCEMVEREVSDLMMMKRVRVELFNFYTCECLWDHGINLLRVVYLTICVRYVYTQLLRSI